MSSIPASSTSDLVRVFDHDPALLAGADAPTAATLRDHGAAPFVRVPEGPWHPPSHRASARHWLGLLVLEGYVARRAALDGRTVVEIVGPGDLLRPWDRGGEGRLVHMRTPWYVLAPTSIAVLDQAFAGVAGRAPAVVAELMRRTLRRSMSLAAAVEIADGPTALDRTERLLRAIGRRWGVQETEGVVLPPFVLDAAVAFLLGEDLVAATDAMAELAERGDAVRRADGRVVLGARLS